MYSVVILSKDASKLRCCINAVRANDVLARIIVVDDGLTAPVTLRESDIAVPGEKPFCYARNANIGILAAGDDDVILLNDDALLETPNGFAALERAALEHPEYGVIGATANNVGNLAQKPHGIGLREDPRMVCFICVYIPRRTIDAVGLLDERFVGYGYDDDDYCLRVRRAGLKIGIHDGCFVDHGTLRSSFRGDPRTPANMTQNHILFVQKWGTHPL